MLEAVILDLYFDTILRIKVPDSNRLYYHSKDIVGG